MKRGELLRHLHDHGCTLLREGAKHSLYVNKESGKKDDSAQTSRDQYIHGEQDLQRPRYHQAERQITAMLAAILIAMAIQAAPPKPCYPIPTPRQLAWQQMEYCAFMHFGPNTFTGNEWGSGSEDPKLFNPTELDCKQWVRVFKRAGMQGVIITAKHHDGFCLWPSKYSTHTVAHSPWKNGKGDVLRELSNACKAEGLKFGIYLSPWDRNHPTYGMPQYNETFNNMLHEVLTQYGDVFEVWFDGANGEGPNGKKQVYDWQLFWSTVRKLAPNAVMFSDVGPDIRWVGNEDGQSAPTCWSLFNASNRQPGQASPTQTEGDENGSAWLPAECDVSIRPGWFWRESENAKVKTVDQLEKLYFESVGQNANFLLNVPPNNQGLISENDATTLIAFRKRLDSLFAKKLTAKASADTSRGPTYQARNVEDNKLNTYWAADNVLTGSLTLDFEKPVHAGVVVIQENIALGQRIKSWDIDAFDSKTWKQVFNGTTIGYKRMFKLNQTLTKLRLNIRASRACPTIATFALYEKPR